MRMHPEVCTLVSLGVLSCCVHVSWQSAVGHEYQSKLSTHSSQTDTSKGFGGKFGVQADRVDQVFHVANNVEMFPFIKKQLDWEKAHY